MKPLRRATAALAFIGLSTWATLASAADGADWQDARARAAAALEAKSYAKAATELAEAIRLLPDDERSAVLPELRAELAEAKKGAATLVIRVPAKGVTVELDGAAVGPSPLTKLVYAEPGEHTVSAVVANQIVASETHTVNAGQSGLFALSGDSDAGDKEIWPAFLIGGVGVAALGVGIGLIVASSAEASDAEDKATAIGKCNLDHLTAACNDLQDTVSTRNALLDGSMVGFVVAGVAAAATIGYLLVPTPDETGDAELGMIPIVAPGLYGLSVQGRF